MNIIKYKKLMVPALILMMFMALVCPPLPAKERRGSTVEVTMTDGSFVRGELLAVKADALLVYDSDDGQGRSIDIQQVDRVKIFRKGKFLEGLGIGLGAGLGMSLFNSFILKNGVPGHYWENLVAGFFILAPISSLGGGISGALAGIDKKISMAGASPLSAKAKLKQLKHYARERDFENPVAD
ncbi:MAG: hypothetical protein MUP71_12445 [Candidatus Aminicenantes bacterium]|nr:hypothetical protein [Candidatus Aminicenantes bacterium]